MRADLTELLQRCGGVVRRADHPELGRRLDRLRRQGELVSVLPGVLCLPEVVDDLAATVRAGSLWAGPNAVITGEAAAALTFWPTLRVRQIVCAVPGGHATTRGRIRITERRIPPEYITSQGGVRLTSTPMTAVDLAAEPDGADAIDQALRVDRVSLDQLWAALESCPDRPGNQRRRAVLRDSRDRPWSAGERRLHRLLRQHRLTGWTTNAWVSVRTPGLGPDGYPVDVLFRRERVIVEFDGFEFHRDLGSFERDRMKRNELELSGYLVLNFTWSQLVDHPDWVLGCIRRALAGRAN